MNKFIDTDKVYVIDGLPIKQVIPAEWYLVVVWNFGRETLKPCHDYGEALDKLKNTVSLRHDLMDRIEIRSGGTTYLMWRSGWTDLDTQLVWESAREAV